MTERTNSLDRPLDDFQRDLKRCAELIVDRYRTMYDADAHAGIAEEVVHGWFDEPLPDDGLAMEQLLGHIADTIIAHPVMNVGTKMFAYVMSGGNQVSVMADMIVSALDQNAAKWHLAPSMTEIERRVIAWTAEFIGLDAGVGGAIVTGGSAANLTGLTVARNLFAENAGVRTQGLFGMTPLITYGSTQTHASLEKSLELLGLGSANFRKIPTTAAFTIDTAALRAQIRADRQAGVTPFCIVGNAGTVNTGAIDPLEELAAIGHEESMWFHVDGAYGGLAASLPELRPRYRGLELADSIALDYHKWLYQPYEVGCTLVKNWQALERSFHKTAEYLDYGAHETRFDISRHHFDLSRSAKSFKVWMSFKAYGAARLGEMIRKDIDITKYLAQKVDEADDFELVSFEPLAIVCFRYISGKAADPSTLDDINARLLEALERDGRVFITGTRLDERQVIRACIINHRMARNDIDYLLATIREVAARESATD